MNVLYAIAAVGLAMYVLAAIGMLALGGLAGGLGRRFAGGLLEQWLGRSIGGTQVGRAIWGVMVAGPAVLAAWFAGVPWWLAAIAAMGMPVGSAVVGNAGFNLGRKVVQGLVMLNPAERRSSMMSLLRHGLAVAAIPAAAMAYAGHYIGAAVVLAVGAACPLFYEAAWQRPLHEPKLGCYADMGTGLYDPPPKAELTWGTTLGVALVAAILLPT